MTAKELQHRIHRKLLEHGWRVQREPRRAGGWDPNRAYWDPAYLGRHGFHPATLIDVGVGEGTPDLYAAFPGAFLVLVEPLGEFDAGIREVLRRRPGVHIAAGAGAAAGEKEIWVEPRWPERSSFFQRHRLEQTGDGAGARRIPVVTLDAVAASHQWKAPFGLKIDTEGAEMEVLEGAAATVGQCEFVIVEVSVLPRFKGSYCFADLIGRMDGAGFAACDFLGIGRADGSEVTFVDVLFTRRGRTDGSS